ncbi:MAG: hypothetical protein ACREEM_00485 [Blastocatellia bacterium]
MKDLRYTLLCDGSSDRALMPILTWTLQQHCPELAIQAEWVDWGRLRNPPRTLSEKIRVALELYECDLLFVHRDAEKEPRDSRVAEIRRALAEAMEDILIPPAVCVIPVRMQEAWLLFDEAALRNASGNPNGKQSLKLPPINKIESLPDPKADLYKLIRKASGLSGRRLQQLRVSFCAQRVPEFIVSFARLRKLPAFKAFEGDLVQVARKHDWVS